jgi:hypothetical protein
MPAASTPYERGLAKRRPDFTGRRSIQEAREHQEDRSGNEASRRHDRLRA